MNDEQLNSIHTFLLNWVKTTNIQRRSCSGKVEVERALGDSTDSSVDGRSSWLGSSLLAEEWAPESPTCRGPFLSAAPRAGRILTLPGKCHPQTPTSPPESPRSSVSYLAAGLTEPAKAPGGGLCGVRQAGGHLYLVCERKQSRRRKTIIQRVINSPGFFLEIWIWKWRFH